jgi:hypothetical protein
MKKISGKMIVCRLRRFFESLIVKLFYRAGKSCLFGQHIEHREVIWISIIIMKYSKKMPSPANR